MEWRTVYGLSFSPSGATKKLTNRVSMGMGGERQACELTKSPDAMRTEFSAGEVLVVGMPVFSGRLPAPAVELLHRLRGEGAPAIPLVVYGNRDYDDALSELSGLLLHQGFSIVGAAAFVARHSIFPAVAPGRPDAADLQRADDFAAACREKLGASEGLPAPPAGIRRSEPYREISPIPLKPTADKRCTGCGLCVLTCPVHAISREAPRKTNRQVCISCTACIAACPVHARSFRSPLYPLASRAFEKKCAARREAELFL